MLSLNAGGMQRLEICDFASLHVTRGGSKCGRQSLSQWSGRCRGRPSSDLGQFVGFCPTATGKPRWWDVAVNAILDKNGHPERLLAVFRATSPSASEPKMSSEPSRREQRRRSEAPSSPRWSNTSRPRCRSDACLSPNVPPTSARDRGRSGTTPTSARPSNMIWRARRAWTSWLGRSVATGKPATVVPPLP